MRWRLVRTLGRLLFGAVILGNCNVPPLHSQPHRTVLPPQEHHTEPFSYVGAVNSGTLLFQDLFAARDPALYPGLSIRRASAGQSWWLPAFSAARLMAPRHDDIAFGPILGREHTFYQRIRKDGGPERTGAGSLLGRAEPGQAPAQEAELQPYESRYSLARRLLALPSRIWDALWWPVGQAMIWEERTAFHERILNILLNDRRTAGVYPIGTLGGAIGTGIGLNMFHNELFGGDEQASIDGIYSGTRDYYVEANLLDPTLGGTPLWIGVDGSYYTDSEEDFFPGGQDSRLDDQRTYTYEQVKTRSEIGVNLGEFSSIGVAAGLSRTTAKSRPEDLAPLPTATPGLGRYSLFEVGLSTSIQWQNDPVYPTRGVGISAAVSHVNQTDGDLFSFMRVNSELRAYLPLLPGERLLAVRTQFQRVLADAGRKIPFLEMPVLGSSLTLRGYERNRLRDTGSLLINVEYRYPIWDTWNAVVFLDEGQVFNRFRELRIDRFKYAVGTGIHLRTRNGFIARVELGVSPERVRPLLQLEQLF